MTIDTIFNDASAIMTAVSFATFMAILYWVYGHKRARDFDQVAWLPFDDEAPEEQEAKLNAMEKHDE